MRTYLALALVLSLTACQKPRATSDTSFESNAVSKVVNGTDQKSTSYPTIREVRTSAQICTGTLIAPRIALTAARCTVDTKGKTVALDAITFGGDKSNAIVKIVAHPALDIAILQLTKDAASGPFYPLLADTIAPATRSEVFGLGDDTTLATGDDGAGFLRSGSMSITGYEAATDTLGLKYQDAGLALSALNTPRGFQSLCHGDIGAPILINAKDKWQIAGIASFRAEGSCLDSREGHAVSIAFVRRWIRKMSGLDAATQTLRPYSIDANAAPVTVTATTVTEPVTKPAASLTFSGNVFSALSRGGSCDKKFYTVYFQRPSLNDGFPLEINRHNGMVFACTTKAQAEHLPNGTEVGVAAKQSVASSGVIGDIYFLSDPYAK